MGIGNASPTAKLHVTGSTGVFADLGGFVVYNIYNALYRGASNIYGQSGFQPDAGTAGIIMENGDAESGGYFANGNNAVIWSPGDNSILRIYDEDGFPVPTQVQSYLNGFSGTPGDWYAGSYNVISDATLKTNISSISSPLSRVLQIKGYKYDINEEIATQHERKRGKTLSQETLDALKNNMGFMAQELKDVFPEAVHYSTPFGKYTINYNAMVPVLVEAIKEQQQQIEVLKAEIEKLKSQK